MAEGEARDVQSLCPSLPAGFRVKPQDDVPGFNVEAQDDPTGLDRIDGLSPESGTPDDLGAWQATLPPGAEDPGPPTPSQTPEWLYKLLTMPLPLLSTAFDPRTGRRIVPYEPLSVALARYPTTALSGGSLPGFDSTEARDPNFIASTVVNNVQQQAQPLPQQPPGRQIQQRMPPPAPVVPGLTNGPPMPRLFRASGVEMAGPERAFERQPSPFTAAYPQPVGAKSMLSIGDQRSQLPDHLQNRFGVENFGVMGSAPPETQAQEPQVPTRVDQASGGAGAHDNGSIISGAYVGNRPIDLTGLGIRWDSNIHPVGDEVEPRDLDRNERHELGVQASIAIHLKRGFELVASKPRAVDVPGFPTPRFYDYIIRDPATDRHYGVEVKTTLHDTIRLDPSQVMKDAIVATEGAKVRLMDVRLSGVSYMTYCFGCEALDHRSATLQAILRGAGIRVRKGSLPGDIPP